MREWWENNYLVVDSSHPRGRGGMNHRDQCLDIDGEGDGGWWEEMETESPGASLDSTCSEEEPTRLGRGGEDGGDEKKQTVGESPGRGVENGQNG